MVTDLSWKAFDNVDLSSSYLWTCPLHWDRRKRILLHNTPSTKLIPWAFVIFVLLFGYLCLSSVLLLGLALFGKISLSLIQTLVCVFLTILAGFVGIVEIATLLVMGHAAVGYNYCIKLERELLAGNSLQMVQVYLCIEEGSGGAKIETDITKYGESKNINFKKAPCEKTIILTPRKLKTIEFIFGKCCSTSVTGATTNKQYGGSIKNGEHKTTQALQQNFTKTVGHRRRVLHLQKRDRNSGKAIFSWEIYLLTENPKEIKMFLEISQEISRLAGVGSIWACFGPLNSQGLCGRTGGRPLPPGKLDILGLILNAFVALFSIYPCFSTPFALYSEYDPLILWRNVFLPPNSQTSFLFELAFHFLRWLLLFPSMLQICRLFPILVLGSTVGCLLIRNCITAFDKTPFRIGQGHHAISAMLRNYLKLEIILQLYYQMSSTCVSTLMGVGLMLEVVVNFATLKMTHVIPMPLYLVCPSLAVLIPAIIHLLLPMAVDIHGKTGQVIKKWKRHAVISLDKKYLTRRLRSTRPLRFSAGLFGFNFYNIVRNTKATYYGAIIYYSITALLSVKVIKV
ncbi:hypothetical protein Fcan01_26808 [Folsomia candida]|uniref:Uncharacterized protein n=1 Tax=Folsomia candida TaxID=158441 RepID=A0A226D286_FOLCA|nr:hypothetical protein Fcan01_26808 [Folsomia candida]